MKTIILLTVVIFLIFSACTYDELRNKAAAQTTTQLKSGEPKYPIDSLFSISLDSVLSDSRCPEDVVCIWEGNAQARFVFVDGEGEVKFTLNTNPQFITERIIRDYKIQLINLTPYPNSQVVIKQSDYRTELLIRKI